MKILVLVLMGLLAGCATNGVRCERHLVPINAVPVGRSTVQP